MIAEETPLLLGSASPRRRDILRGLGIPIVVSAADIVEDVCAGESAERYLERIVSEKLEAVIARARADAYGAVLVADTSVILDDRILGKPADVEDAVRLLSDLVGRTHRVCTRYAVAAARSSQPPLVSRTVTTLVTMRAASPAEVRRYAETGEGLDKAGAYAAQGVGAFLVERIEGSYTNVVGLPACELVADLVRVGLLARYP